MRSDSGDLIPASFVLPLITGVTIVTIALTLYCFSHGISTVFMHLYYLPIILIAYFYRRRGIPVFTGLSLFYLALAVIFLYPSEIEIGTAVLRAGMFILIGVVVAELSERLERKKEDYRLAHEYEKSIIENANVWLMVLDPTGRILGWNRAAEQISGYPAADVMGGKEIWKNLYPEKNYRNKITGKITEIIQKDNYLENLQTTIVSKNGTKKTIVWNTRGLPDSEGVIRTYIAIGIDITDREKVAQVSREYADWYSTILRTTRDGYNLVDTTGRLIEVNDNYCRMTGFSRDELLGRSISDQDVNETKDVALAHMQKIFTTGSDRFETRHRTKDGGTIDVEVSVVLQAQKQQFIVFIRDITERKHAEMEISSREEKFHTMADFTADWEYWQGQDKQIIYMSPSCHRITGYTQQEFLANPDLLETIIYPDDLASVKEHNHVAWETRQALSTDFRIIHRDGTIRWIGHACRHVYDSMGNALGRRVSNRDITDRKLLEIRLTESEGRLKEIIESMIAGVVIIDPETHIIIDVNSVAARMIGAEKDEIIGSVCHRYICPAEIGACPLTDLEQGVDRSEKVLLTHHGEKIPIIKSVVSIHINKHPYLLESFIDITDMKRAESAVRESEEKYRAFFSTSRDCVFITSVDGHWIDFNNSAVELFGYESRDELMAVNIADLYAHPDERNIHLKFISERGFSKDYPVDLKKKDGTIISTLISSVARKDDKGTIIGFQGVVRDITELKRTEMELQELAAVVRHSGELIGIATLDGKINFLNDAGARMVGIQPADAIGKEFFWYIPDHLKQKLHEEVLPALRKQGTWSGDLQYINQKSGNLVDVHAMTFAITDPATGKPQYIADVSLDITDRKRAEEALTTSQIQLTEAMDLAHMAHWELDVSTGIFTFNDRFYALYGTTAAREGGYQMPAEVYAKNFVHPEDAHLVADEVDMAIASPDPDYTRQIEHRIVRRDGEVRHIIVRFGITKDAEGRTVKTHGANQDITERKRMEEALYTSQQVLRSVLDTIPVRVFWKDHDLKYLGCNAPFAQDAGFHEPEELIGKDDYQMGWREQAELYRADDRQVIDTGKPKMFIEEPQTTPDGRTIWLLTSKTPLRTSSGKISGVLGAYIDITDRKRMEEVLRQVNKQLNLLSSITRHDILNQLMALKGYLYLSHEMIDNPTILAGYLKKEEQAANAIENQITFTRDYQELGVAAPEWQSVNASIETALLALPMRAVHVEIDPHDPEIFADRLFEKVFYNLIDNALRYGGADMKTIRVSSQEIDSALHIVCEDDGVGISAEDKKRLFTRGFGKNTGLGLFLSREILAITRITITENGTPGKGARFEIVVPKGMWRMKGAGA
jgi:PAS domain S-box-containing protein